MSEDKPENKALVLEVPLSTVTPVDKDRGNLNSVTSLHEVENLVVERHHWEGLTRERYLAELKEKRGEKMAAKVAAGLTEQDFEDLKEDMLHTLGESQSRMTAADQHCGDNQCGSRNAIRKGKMF